MARPDSETPAAPSHDDAIADPQLAGENHPAFDPRTGRRAPEPGAPEPIARRMGRDHVVGPRLDPRSPNPEEKA